MTRIEWKNVKKIGMKNTKPQRLAAEWPINSLVDKLLFHFFPLTIQVQEQGDNVGASMIKMMGFPAEKALVVLYIEAMKKNEIWQTKFHYQPHSRFGDFKQL